MRNLFLIGMVSVVLFGVSSAAMAWNFTMTGEAEWRYRYWTRTGPEDIFGSMGNDVYLGINHLKTFPTTRSTNRGSGTFGVMAGENRFGADMNLNDMNNVGDITSTFMQIVDSGNTSLSMSSPFPDYFH